MLDRAPDLARAGARAPEDRVIPPRGRALGAREVEGLAVRAREAEGLLAGAREAEGLVARARGVEDRLAGARDAEGLAVRAREAGGVTAAPRRDGACRVDIARLPRVAGAERVSGVARGVARVTGAERALDVDRFAGTVPALASERVMFPLGRALLEARLRGVTVVRVTPRLETLGARLAFGEFVRPAVPSLVIAVARFPGLVIWVADRPRAASEGRALETDWRPTAVRACPWLVLVARERAVALGRALAVRVPTSVPTSLCNPDGVVAGPPLAALPLATRRAAEFLGVSLYPGPDRYNGEDR